jgi:hypothetical protein
LISGERRLRPGSFLSSVPAEVQIVLVQGET